MGIELKGIIAEYNRAVNAHDTDAIMATFAKDAYVNDNKREIAGSDAIRRWVEKEVVGDKLTIEVREVLHHYGDTIVRGAYDVAPINAGAVLLMQKHVQPGERSCLAIRLLPKQLKVNIHP